METMRTLQRQVNSTIRRKKPVTEDCSEEFNFVKFQNESYSKNCLEGKNLTETCIEDTLEYQMKRELGIRLQPDSGVRETGEMRSTSKKGPLWYQKGNLFSTWEEKFFVLTANSLYSFPKDIRSMEVLTKSASKTKLCEIIYMELINKKGQMMIKFLTKKQGTMYLRKAEGLKDWYDSIEENMENSKYPHLSRKLNSSISMIEGRNLSDKYHRKPFMGVRSLTLSQYH